MVPNTSSTLSIHPYHQIFPPPQFWGSNAQKYSNEFFLQLIIGSCRRAGEFIRTIFEWKHFLPLLRKRKKYNFIEHFLLNLLKSPGMKSFVWKKFKNIFPLLCFTFVWIIVHKPRQIGFSQLIELVHEFLQLIFNNPSSGVF